MKKLLSFALLAAFLVIALSATGVCAQASGFTLINKTVIGGEGGWDYLSVDSQNRRLYVSHATQQEIDFGFAGIRALISNNRQQDPAQSGEQGSLNHAFESHSTV